MSIRHWIVFLALALAVAFPAQTVAQAVGQVTQVRGGATLISPGRRGAVQVKMPVSNGDVIRTNGSGHVELVFADNTKIAIGPKSKFTVEDVTLSSSNRARRFSISATAGTFRFLSGRSAKGAYEIKTPTATMGIRGTEFDFTVRGRRVTQLLTHGGVVQICNASRSCARVRGGGCNPVTAPRRGRVQVPDDRAERAAILRADFPFATDQRRVSRSLRVNVTSCQRLIQPAVQRNQNSPASGKLPNPTVPKPDPQPEPNPDPSPDPGPDPSPDPGPDPGPEPSEAPGKSGTKGGGNSQGKGNSQSDNAGGKGNGHDR